MRSRTPAEIMADLARRREAAGGCVRCGGLPEPGRKRCRRCLDYCRNKQRAYDRARGVKPRAPRMALTDDERLRRRRRKTKLALMAAKRLAAEKETT